MRKTREEKAITLIALIITIVVLLILAVVAINAVTGDGIIQHAVNAKTSYENAQAKEQGMLTYYETYLQTEGKAGKWIQEGSTLKTTNTDGTITKVKIGDYVNYNEGINHKHTPDVSKGAGTIQTGGSKGERYSLTSEEIEITEDKKLNWRVLGINKKGELELISENPTETILYLANDMGYLNLEENLNDFCNDLYGQGTGATGARSLNVEDINKLTNYNPTTYSGYGNKWIYRYPTQEEMDSCTGKENSTRYMQYSIDGGVTWNNITDLSRQKFKLPNESTIIDSQNTGSRELTVEYFSYNIEENLTIEDGFKIEEVTKIVNMITKGTGTSNVTQWLASYCISCGTAMAGFNTRYIYNGCVNTYTLFRSDINFGSLGCSVRPIVSLSSKVSLIGDGADVGSLNNKWVIS